MKHELFFFLSHLPGELFYSFFFFTRKIGIGEKSTMYKNGPIGCGKFRLIGRARFQVND